jgi:hypothetical protein
MQQTRHGLNGASLLNAVFGGHLGGRTMDAEIASKLRASFRRTGVEFEEIQPGKTEEFVGHIAGAYANLLGALGRFAEPAIVAARTSSRPDSYDTAWYLLWGAANSLTAAWALVERGYPTEPLAVARHAMEKVASAVVLFDNPSLLPKFKAGKLGNTFSTQCIGPVGQVISDFGRTYGTLSEFGAHVGPDAVLLPLIPTASGEGKPAFPVAGDFRNEGPERELWSEIADLLCAVARDILEPAPNQLFFNVRRREATFPSEV